ncbi:hypothetical protein LU631_04405 [Erwinia tracheiphila]|uniref:Uncharacterized protein n=1 Tax=Erwinia tracheiphila TaxID=65700 RepID=A0A0M2KE84_9GAMM|nr:hypothetical protein [Erwinia tracheiphila]AXF75861.1 hypothetical protein AV903_06930 [Erwinia tracheiphila]KKF37244.1 hypothetical protein SY86_20435 [Erwinia tracheiphila]UIA85487.1 hypothetical protein LU604_12310 [Erwinia tracheiphila]UIA88638.1 hypothetical protein LU631_04405 [Erwinia tracheiphila]UIA94009.1 hypothetical protein LU632_11880 [Erwinia tracheiphila]
MRAREFNRKYPVGTHFIYQPCAALRGGAVIKTKDVARDLKTSTIVEISVKPYYANIKSLTPAG